MVDGDRVYTFGVEGMLHCLTAAGGKVLWKLDTAAEFNVIQNFFGVGSTPLVEGDLLIVGGFNGAEMSDCHRYNTQASEWELFISNE